MPSRIEPGSAYRLMRYGDRGVLVELADHLSAAAVARHLENTSIDDVILGACTIMLCGPEVTVSDAGALVEAAINAAAAGKSPPSRHHDVPTVYDGADLNAVADELGVSVEALVTWHRSTTFEVAFLGFVAGFAYMRPAAASPSLGEVSRRAEPRPAVPRGAVALAGPWCGVYPSELPGGWRLIGHTEATLFDPGLARPTLFEAGDTVRFVAAA
jgi:KipI family sensor histidine kinase inhibitor